MPEFIKDCQLELIDGAPHGLNWTHATEMNALLINFLSQKIPAGLHR